MISARIEARRGISSSARHALQIVGLFSIDRQSLGVSQIGRELGITKSKASRLVATLAAEGFLSRASDRRYRLGLRLLDLGEVAARSHEVYGPTLAALIDVHRASGESTHLAVLDGLEVVHLERLQSDHLAQLTQGPRYRSPVHATGTGKVLLAYAPSETVERVIAAGLLRLTPATRTDPGRFRAELEQIRSAGYHVCREEFVDGISSVAVPITDAQNRVLAVMAVVTKANDLTADRTRSLLALLQRTAARVAKDDAFANEVDATIRRRTRSATNAGAR